MPPAALAITTGPGDTLYRTPGPDQPYHATIHPRGVLAEFGTELPDDCEIRVWDSTAEIRYLVIPERPAGTEGLSEDELAALVTRDGMIGTTLV